MFLTTRAILLLFGGCVMIEYWKYFSLLIKHSLKQKEYTHAVGVANDVSLTKYAPSNLERYFMDNLSNLGYNETSDPSTCNIWSDPSITTSDIHKDLIAYAKDLESHTLAVQEFEMIPDLLTTIQENSKFSSIINHNVCKTARPHPDGVRGLFPNSQLSLSDSGYIDPLLPPMRNNKICENMRYLMSLDYLVHDFEAMCRKLKPTSRRVLIDMGASLDFHGREQPIVVLMELYKKFGFSFDHIYAFEMTPSDPKKLFTDLLPEKYLPSYHWINVGVVSDEGAKLNPLHSILKTFNEDDLIVVKLDIDTSWVEMPLALQLLEDKDGIYHRLVDQFYFEHHVHLGELSHNWRGSMSGSIKDSFELFHGLRLKGIPAHFWP
eukprot:CAMPEP_0198303720 /NCGR_PEP_ID=MMETSP1449-20131203/57035_1 /TAXON_ID=420275 /ORGANISM="Attheya septentrionalis, Strain CCMP2084" /LENGTH=377 /DNA_ID=CAMNT_0044006227 /DNA_START=108 /DNA_END=1241 /DNA_ORIENTATION=+